MTAPLQDNAYSNTEQRRGLGARRILKISCVSFVVTAFALVVGTAWHEIVGHGLTAVSFGARITYVEVLGFQLFPGIRWLGATGRFGYCDNSGVEGVAARALILLAGSLSTWLVGVAATGLLYLRPWRGWKRVFVIAFSVWWLDLFLYTLPSLGIPRYFFWGHRYSEPYEAAVALGVPGPVFQGFVIVANVILAWATGRQILRAIRETGIRHSTFSL